VASDKIVELLGSARGCHDAKPMRERCACKLPAKVRRTTGDEPNRGSVALLTIGHSPLI
jgi:hypothetical protein